jgi:hypothetical protein
MPLLPEDDVLPSYEQLGGVLQYTAKNLVVAVETNIKQHFVEYVESYVDAVWHKDATVALIEKLVPRKDRAAEKRALDRKLRVVEKDLLSVTHGPWEECIGKHRRVVLPGKSHVLAYDLECRPQDYLAPMLRMTAVMESMGKKLRSVLPVRTSVVPMHITLDTATLVALFYSDAFQEKFGMGKGKLLHGNVVPNKDDIWGLAFHTNRRTFRAKLSWVLILAWATCCISRATTARSGNRCGTRRSSGAWKGERRSTAGY